MTNRIPQSGSMSRTFALDEHGLPTEDTYQDVFCGDGVYYLGCLHQVTIDMTRLHPPGTPRPSFAQQLAEAVDIMEEWYIVFDDLRSARLNLLLRGK